MSALDSLFDAAKDALYLGVGAAAKATDSAKDVADDLIAHGKEVVANSKDKNGELLHNVKDKSQDAALFALKEALRVVSEEDREEFLAKIQQIIADLNSTPVEVEVDEAEATEDSDK